jgi:hypothetical protein
MEKPLLVDPPQNHPGVDPCASLKNTSLAGFTLW